MRVLHVETGRHLYGGALQVAYLVRGLAARGIENLLVCPAGSAISGEGFPEGVEVMALPMSGDVDLAFVWRLKRIIRRFHPDVVHLHSRRGADWLGGLAASLSGVPAVLSRRVSNPESRMFVGMKYRLFDRVIAISTAIHHGLIDSDVPGEKIRMVHSAVPRPDPMVRWDRDRLLAEFGLPAGSRLVGMAAQFIPRKGHDVLLAAVPKVLSRCPDTRFLVFGRGPLEEKVRQEVQSGGLADYVRLAGFRSDLPSYIGCFDVLAHPARDEGLGVILLQACAAGVPVVATPVGGIPEIVQDRVNGLMVEPGDAEGLARALIQLLEAKDMRIRFGRAGRDLVETEFSVEKMVDGNLAVYRELAT